MLAASRRAPTGIRNRALVAVMYYAGLRLAEALALLPRHVDLDEGQIQVERGKGHKPRRVGFNVTGMPHVERWMEVRTDRGIATNAQPLFCTLKGGKLDPRYVRQFLDRYAEKAGIEKRVHPHGLRHSFAANLANRGVPMHKIQKQLGHSSLAITDGYLNSIAPAETVKAVRDLDWNGDGESAEPDDEIRVLRRQLEALQERVEQLAK
jgi:site-specific recombinase XerD